MHKILISIATCLLINPLHAGINKASAVWIPETERLSADQTLRTVIVMTVEEGWHTYWENPGEGGLSLAIKPQLPDGWKTGEIQHPAPIRFMTGQLPGFGYEGTVHFPITLTPPTDFTGKIPTLSAKLIWLTCNDSSCVPGSAEMTLSGKTDPQLIAKSYENLPQEIPNARLALIETEEAIVLKLTLPADSGISPTEYELFPATEEIVDPAAKIRFEKDPSKENTWISTWPKNEYLTATPETFTLVLDHQEKPALKVSKK